MNRRIRILLIDHTAKLGGGELALLSLVGSLDRTRYEPIVLLCQSGPLEEKMRAIVETHLLELAPSVQNLRKDSVGWKTLLSPIKMTVSIRYAYRLLQKIRSLKPDVIHTNSLKADILGGVAARVAGVPLIWHIRDRIEDTYLPTTVVRAFRWLCRVIPNSIIANSRSTLETLQLRSRSQGIAIPSGFDVDSFKEAGARSETLTTALEAGKPLRIGMVGRITPWKGQHVFLRAAARIKERYPMVQFTIVGSALFGEEEYEESLRHLVKELALEDSVQFQGFRSDIAEAIGTLHVLVHASVTPEPLGQVIAQGMAANKPVVATAGGGASEMIVHERTGLLVQPGDDISMAEAIIKLLNSPALAEELASGGQRYAIGEFAANQVARRVEAVYETLLPYSMKKDRTRFRILHYNTTASISGAEIVLLDVLRGLHEDRFDSVVACPNGSLSKACEAENVRVVLLDELQARFTLNPMRLLNYIWSVISTALALRKTVQREQPDLINANSIRAGIVSTFATAGIRVPIQWHLHDMLPKHPISFAVRFIAAASRKSTFVAVSSATLTGFCGTLFRQRLARAGTVILNGINTHTYHPASTEIRKQLRRDLNIQDGQLFFAHIGQVSVRKDQMGMLKAFQSICLDVPNAILLFVGTPIFESGKLYAEKVLKAAAPLVEEGRVRFLGFRKDIPQIMQACDLLIINSLGDPCPLTVLEGMSSGTPILGSDVDGIPELLTENITGWLTPPNRPKQLSARIREIANMSELERANIGQNARNVVLQQHSIEKYRVNFSDCTLKRIREFIGNPRPHKALPAEPGAC